MKNEFYILKKDEAYSFDELACIAGSVKKLNDFEILEKVEKLMASIQDEKNNMAVFFMPKNTYDIFSQFQGISKICEISSHDVEFFLKGVNFSETAPFLKNHLLKKLSILSDFISQGNEVNPVPIQASNLEKIELD